MVDLTGDVALQDARDLADRLALAGAFRDIGLGAFVAGHSDEGDPIERRVRLAVAAPVESVALDLS